MPKMDDIKARLNTCVFGSAERAVLSKDIPETVGHYDLHQPTVACAVKMPLTYSCAPLRDRVEAATRWRKDEDDELSLSLSSDDDEPRPHSSAPKFGTEGRFATPRIHSTPGPAEYTPRHSYTRRSTPQQSIGLKYNRQLKLHEIQPGPGAYKVKGMFDATVKSKLASAVDNMKQLHRTAVLEPKYSARPPATARGANEKQRSRWQERIKSEPRTAVSTPKAPLSGSQTART